MKRNWKPTGLVTDFLGRTVDEELDFFHHPPEEIGEVLAAESTLRHGEIVASPLFYWGFIAVKVLVLCLSFYVPALTFWPRLIVWTVLGTLLFGPLPQSKEVCSYVGTHGVAVATCHGSRERSKVRTYHYGASPEVRVDSYSGRRGISYSFAWNGPDAGSHSGQFHANSGANYHLYSLARYLEQYLAH